MSTLWDNDELPVSDYLDVPRWIDQDITAGTIAAILQGGCDSGAYMPAVTYWQALETMNEYGDDIADVVSECYEELTFNTLNDYWAGFACKLVSIAVELWAFGIEDELTSAIEEMLENDE